jgi:hypothetical protein
LACSNAVSINGVLFLVWVVGMLDSWFRLKAGR